jgi:hypothetical protein
MAHFAQVVNGTVVNVIVAELEYIATIDSITTGDWVQTSYNTHGGVHTNGGTPLRKNYAGVGYTYDTYRDAFIPPKPYSKWVLNESTCLWEPPIPRPNDGNVYEWDDPAGNWVLVQPLEGQ